MLFGAGSEPFFGLAANRKTVARNSPSTHSDKVSCVYGSLGTYASTSSMAAKTILRGTMGIDREVADHREQQEGLYGGAFRSTFRLRLVATLAHMMLKDDTYARSGKHPS